MRKIVRHLSLLLVFVFVLSAGVFNVPKRVAAAEVKTYVGDMTVSRMGIGWTAGTYENQLMVVKPGSKLEGLYFGKVYAVYNSAKGGYVVTEKAGLHCSYSKTVATGAVGLAISYQPLTTTGSAFARGNWLVWQQIRIGDILTLSGIDLTAGTVDVSGTFGTSDFSSNAKVSVTTVRDSMAAKTGYSDKVIAVLGDSVTAGGGWTETVEAGINGRVINVSTPGARTDEGLGYFDSQIAVHNPDIVFIKYAINDCIQGTVTSSTLPNYKQNLRDLCDMALEIGAFPILLTTNNIKIASLNYDRYAAFGGLSAYFPQYMQAIRDVAAEYNTFCIDIYSGVWSGLTATDYLIDTVHPDATGYGMEATYITNYLLENESAIIAAVNEVTGDVSNMPEASTNYLASSAGGQYMYSTTTYPGGSGYYATAYYGDNSNQGGAYFSGKLNDGVIPVDGIPNTTNTDWAVYFANATTPTIYLKLSKGAYLNNISIICRNGSSSGVNYVAPVISSVSVSSDGSNYTATTAYSSRSTVYSGLNYRIKLAFNEIIKTQYICITLATPTDRTAIGEIQVWGDDAAPNTGNFELVAGSEYTLADGFVTIGEGGDLSSDVIAQFACEVKVTDANGAALSASYKVGTGCVVAQYDSTGSVIASATVILMGDADGDAAVTNTDYLAVKARVKSLNTTMDCYGMAADLSGDGSVTAADLLNLKSIIS